MRLIDMDELIKDMKDYALEKYDCDVTDVIKVVNFKRDIKRNRDSQTIKDKVDELYKATEIIKKQRII